LAATGLLKIGSPQRISFTTSPVAASST